MSRGIFLLFVLGLILRIALSIPYYTGDVHNHISWAKDILINGPSGIYEREFYFRYGTLTPNYPPLILFFFAGSYKIYEIVMGSTLWLSNNFPIFPSNIVFFLQGPNIIPAFLKIPAILGDMGVAYCIYLFSKKVSSKKSISILAVSLVLFNPAFFYNSTIWGQVDVVPLFLILAAIYTLIYHKIAYIPIFLFTLAILSKQTAAIFAPLMMLLFIKKFKIEEIVKSFVCSIVIFVLLFFPFSKDNFLTEPFLLYWGKILNNSVSDYVTYHAFNAWYLIVGSEKIHDSLPFIFNLSFQVWGYLLFGLVGIIVLWRLWKSNFDQNIVTYSFGLVAFASFLFMTRLHERHFEPVLPFLLLISIKDRKTLPIFFFASIFYTLNLYHDFWSPDISLLVNIITQNIVIKILVLANVFCFLVLLFNYVMKFFINNSYKENGLSQ